MSGKMLMRLTQQHNLHLPRRKPCQPRTNQYASAFHAFDFVLINISTLLKKEMVPVQRFVKPISTLSPPLEKRKTKKHREKLSREFAQRKRDWSDKNKNKTSSFRRRLMKMFGYTSSFFAYTFVCIVFALSSALVDYWLNEKYLLNFHFICHSIFHVL